MIGKEAFASALCMILLSASAVAQSGDEVIAGQEAIGSTHELDIFQGTTISAEQGVEVDRIIPRNWAVIRPMREQLQAIRSKISDQLFSKGDTDAAGLAALQKQAALLESSANAQLLKTEIELREILQPHQLMEVSRHYQELASARAEEQRTLANLGPYAGSSVGQSNSVVGAGPAAMAAGHELDILRGATLSSAQATQVGRILSESSARRKPTQQQLSAVQIEISNRLFSPDKIDVTQLLALQEQETDLTNEIRAQSLNNAIEFRETLTHAQIAQIAENHQHLIEVQSRERALGGSSVPN